MWSPNLILKAEKQRDIFAYITLLIFQVKKGSLKTFPFVRSAFSYTFRFQVYLLNSVSSGKISSLPSSISAISTSFAPML